AVRFYLARGMWVASWKRTIVFCSDPGTPVPRIDVGDSAKLSIEREDETIVLARAERIGDALCLAEPDSALDKDENLGNAAWNAEGTLSLAVALHGWPLVRSPQHWEKHYHADGGP